MAPYEPSESSCSSHDPALAAAMAALARAPPKNFRAVKREWAAIRIQTAFRAFLVQLCLLTFSPLAFYCVPYETKNLLQSRRKILLNFLLEENNMKVL